MVVRLWRQTGTADAAETRVSHSTNKACLRRKQDLFTIQTRLLCTANTRWSHGREALFVFKRSLVCSRKTASGHGFGDDFTRKRGSHHPADTWNASRRCQKFLPKRSVALSDICLFRQHCRQALPPSFTRCFISCPPHLLSPA